VSRMHLSLASSFPKAMGSSESRKGQRIPRTSQQVYHKIGSASYRKKLRLPMSPNELRLPHMECVVAHGDQSANPSFGKDQLEVAADRFARDGAVCLRGVFDPACAELVARGIARNLACPSEFGEWLGDGRTSARFFNDYCNWRRIAEFETYMRESGVAEIAKRIMKSNTAVFYHEHVLVKELGTTKRTPWHQDQPYYPIDGGQMISVWMPVDPVPEASTLRFIRGSHLWNRWFRPQKFATGNKYDIVDSNAAMTRYEDLDETEMDSQIDVLAWACEPGDCVVFHGLTLHSAHGHSNGACARRVISTRWVGDDAIFATRPWEVSPPFSGGLQPGDPFCCDMFPRVC